MTERLTGFYMQRRIFGITQEQVAEFEQIFREEAVGISKKAISSARFDTRASRGAEVLHSDELRAFQTVHGLPATEESIDELADYLDHNLPDQVDKEIYIPTYPAVVYAPGYHKRSVYLGAGETPAMADRRLVLATIHDFYNIDEPVEENWREIEFQQRAELLRTGHFHSDTIISEVSRLLGKYGDVFPEVLEYSPLEIHDTLRVDE
jgi:hypothetical protein